MASPGPEGGASVESKPVDVAPSQKEKESKPEINGHTSTTEPKSPRIEPEKSTINGSSNVDGKKHGASNGTPAEDEKMTDADETPASPALAQPEKQPAATNSDAKSSEPEVPPQANEEFAKPDSAKDVEMADLKPESEGKSNDDPEGKSHLASAEPSGKSSGEAKKSPKSTPQADGNLSAAESAPEKEKEGATPTKPAGLSSASEQAAKPAPDGTAAPEVDLGSAGISQLAIEATEADSSNIQESVEVSMTDAPVTKVVREREDDAADEPAAKRAKTEPKEDDGAEPTPIAADGGFINYPKARFDEFENWYDPDNDAKEITPHRRREMRKVFARIKKTKAGGGFRDSVQRLWPGLWDKYSVRIEKPMDLGEIDRNLRDGKYATFSEFKADLALILENSQQFNGPTHEVTAQARSALLTLWIDVERVGVEEPTKSKQSSKPRMRESRSALVKPDELAPSEPSPVSATAGGSIGVVPVVAAPVAKPTVSEARRASSATEGDRPKRTVRAPKPKDIDYSSKPSRKKLKPELQFCDEVLQELMSGKHWGMNQWFLDPVDAEGLGIPDYYSIIKHPMDLGKIAKLLGSGEITSIKDFDKHVRLMFDNCYQFNGPPSSGGVSIFAKQLQDLYTSQMKGKDAWLAKHAKANPPPASTSNASDEDEEDEEEEQAEAVPAGPDPSREVKELEARLREETDKVNNLFTAEQPNQSMIEIQQGIVRVVQEALLKAKIKLNEYRQKHGAGKPAKKSKPAKPKAGGSSGGASRKSGVGAGAVAPKKSGHPKKKKILTAQDKDNIANAINDLEGQHLDRAIDIIKRDTGQMESEDGELELDIDQLSPEALLRLWELCKKVLPGFGKDPNAAQVSSPEVQKSSGAKPAKSAPKGKKNKPMSAQEQEQKIAHLRQIQELYSGGQEPPEAMSADARAAAADESSDDSSEEE